MRSAILAAALATSVAAFAAPAENVAFTKPLMDRPSDLPALGESWPQAPSFASPLLQTQQAPTVVLPPDTEPPEENHLHRGPTSEEWHCLVPLQQAQPTPKDGTAAPTRCQTPSLEPHQLFHLL